MKLRTTTLRLTLLHLQILIILTWCARVATESQLARKLNVEPRQLRSQLRTLRKRRLVAYRTTTIADFQLTGPLTASEPGTRTDFGALAWILEQRWREAPRCPARVVWATRLATRIVGGVSGQLRQPLQVQHDLGVTEILVGRSQEPSTQWLGEDAYRAFWSPSRKDKVPDAVIIGTDEEVCRVIEFGGRYSRAGLEAFHLHWLVRHGTPYEIW